MANGPKVPNDALLAAGLSLMEQNGKPLKRIDAPGRSMMYALPNGERVRVRTCNDHALVILANSPIPEKATLNIEGTEHLLVVMPENPRTPGKVIAYLVPSHIAAKQAKEAHATWLKTNPNTKGDNRTYNLWFDGNNPWSGFAKKWAEYRLQGEASTVELKPSLHPTSIPSILPSIPVQGGIKAAVEAARDYVAVVAGVPRSAVRITVDFGT